MSAQPTTLTESQPVCLCCHSESSSEWAVAEDYEFASTGNEKFTYRQCNGCGSLYIDPIPADRLSTIYPGNYYSFTEKSNSFIYKIKEFLDQRFFGKVLKDIPGDNLNVLDIGGGTGWLLDTVRSIDARVKRTQVVDIDSQAEKHAQEHGHNYFCGRIEEFSTEEKYDLVLLLNLIEHVADPGAVLEKIASLLSNNGRVIVKTPNIDSLDARLFRKSYWGGLHCPRHWVLFSEQSMRELVERSGLRVEKLALTQGAPFWTWSVLIWLHKRGMVRIDRERSVMQHPAHDILLGLFAGFDFVRGIFSKTSQMMLVLGKKS